MMMTIVEWMKFEKCVELLQLQIKRRAYRSYVRAAILYEIEKWVVRETREPF